MKKIINNLDKIIILIAVIIFVMIGSKYKNESETDKNQQYIIDQSNTETTKENIKELSNQSLSEYESKNEQDNVNEIVVHISGCVQNQGVYTLNSNSRINDLVKLAGGLCKNADLERINLSTKLQDEMKIHIYKIGEKDKTKIVENQNSNLEIDVDSNKNISKKVNINTASIDELTNLSGIGETRAKDIIEYRNNNKFEKIEDLMNISGIGKKTFEKIKEMITID